MSETFLQLSEDEFDRRFPLLPNHLNASTGWSNGESDGCLFETYGEELAFVREQDPRHVWTLLGGDDGDLYVASGFHVVNRIGYLISRDPVPDGVCIEVRIPMDAGDNTEESEEP